MNSRKRTEWIKYSFPIHPIATPIQAGSKCKISFGGFAVTFCSTKVISSGEIVTMSATQGSDMAYYLTRLHEILASESSDGKPALLTLEEVKK